MTYSTDAILFFFGLVNVLAFAFQRFNEPSFQNRDTLPRTVIPLRYLFLKSAYQHARLIYVVALLVTYVLLVASGPYIIPTLKQVGIKDFPPEAWALAVALIITGVSAAPSSLKWLNKIEELIRRWVHTWYHVPDGIRRTVGILEDADYEPPRLQLNAVSKPLRKQIKEDLKLPRDSLRYRWARASMLMQVLKHMGAGGNQSLKIANFKPFRDDLEEVQKSYKAVGKDIADAQGNISEEKEEKLIAAVDDLLRAIYAYISWGIRHQMERQHGVDDTLKELGFQIPDLGERRLFDIMAPPIALLAAVTITFYLAAGAALRATGLSNSKMEDIVIDALSSTVATSAMYGWAVFISLKQRSAQIEQKVWRHKSPTRLAPIALRAGFVALIMITIATIVSTLPRTLQSLPALANAITAVLTGQAVQAGWEFLPARVATALPWCLAGGAASVMLAYFLGGDVRRTSRAQRGRDAVFFGIGLGLAATAAQLIQIAFSYKLLTDPIPLITVPVEGLVGVLCGTVIGFFVPAACRTNLLIPSDPKIARALGNLLHQAEIRLHGREAAADWVFTPHHDLPGITPAEAVQYEGLATGVLDLLPGQARNASTAGASDSGGRSVPIIVDRSKVRNDQRLPVLIDADEVRTSPESAPATSRQVSTLPDSAPTASDEANPHPS